MPRDTSIAAGLNALSIPPPPPNHFANIDAAIFAEGPPLPDPGYKFKLKFSDSYHECHEKLAPHFDYMREYLIRQRGWVPRQHLDAFEKLHNDWMATTALLPEKGFWKNEIITRKGHTLVANYWSQLKALKWQLS
ncbi:hypothetical protein FRB99_003343, partial [Tulasnella sp. 403]